MVWSLCCRVASIKEISEQYSNDSLEIISVNIDNDSSKFGGLAMIPTLFLIDKSGTIIYNRNYRKDITAELPILKSVLKEKISIDNYNSKKIYDNISIKTEQR